MSDTTSTTNGTTDKVTSLTNAPDPGDFDAGPYRPEASTAKVYDRVVESLSRIVVGASYEAATFVNLANIYDMDEGTAVRCGHLVDAAECLEIAMTYLGQLRGAVAYRLRIEDDQNTGNGEF